MWNWWYGEKKPPTEEKSLGQSINESMDTVDGLTAKRMQLLQKSHNALKEAKEFKKQGNAARAMSCMKQKQHYDQQAKMYEGMILNMEKTSMALESTATTVQVAKTMKSGTTQMKNILKDVSVDDVDTIADDLDDSMRDATEIANALSRPMGMNDPEEDDLIMAEMEGWEDEKVVEKVINFPELPERKIKEEKKKVVKE
jgi:hypothetical protein